MTSSLADQPIVFHGVCAAEFDLDKEVVDLMPKPLIIST